MQTTRGKFSPAILGTLEILDPQLNILSYCKGLGNVMDVLGILSKFLPSEFTFLNTFLE